MRKLRPSRLLIFPILFGLLVAFNNCGIQRPSVENMDFASVGYEHTGVETSCFSCHETQRPAVAASVLHGNGADCVACHTSTNDMSTAGGVINDIWLSTSSSYTHTVGLNSCVNCHAPNRPAPVAGFAHYGKSDCVSCHFSGTSNNTDGLTLAQIQTAFRTAYSYSHPGAILSCKGCHEKNRPAPTHNPGQDCVSCHDTDNTWTNSLSDAQIRAIWLGKVK